MRIGVVQTNPKFGETRKNLDNALSLMETTAADLYVLPELFNTGYNFIDDAEVRILAEPADGITFRKMIVWTKKRSCYVVYGFAEQADKVFNSASLVGPEGLIGLYRKVHLYDREKLLFTPGDLGFKVFDTVLGKIGMMICFDWIFPESARTLALNGAQLIAHPANLVLPYCPDAMVTRCLENRIFAATANRIGSEHRGGIDLQFIGLSEIVAPNGSILVRLKENEEGVAVDEVNLLEAKDKYINTNNDLFADRRPEQYERKCK